MATKRKAETFGKALADARRAVTPTLRQCVVADASGLSKAQLSRVESGHRKVPTLDVRRLLYAAIGLTLKEQGALERLARAECCVACGKPL